MGTVRQAHGPERGRRAGRRPTWAPRVSRYKIAQLYRTDATGIRDDDLVNDVGYAFLVRIHDILKVTDAHQGRVHCPECEAVFPRPRHESRMRASGQLLKCESCGWTLTWGEYYRSYRNKHLLAGGMGPFFSAFARDFPAARTYGEKMILIDTLLHRYHWELEGDPGGPGAVGLIGGSRTEVIAFLNELTYAGGSTPGLQQTRTQWRKKLGWAGWTEENVDERSREHRWEGFRREDRRVTE